MRTKVFPRAGNEVVGHVKTFVEVYLKTSASESTRNGKYASPSAPCEPPTIALETRRLLPLRVTVQQLSNLPLCRIIVPIDFNFNLPCVLNSMIFVSDSLCNLRERLRALLRVSHPLRNRNFHSYVFPRDIARTNKRKLSYF